MNARLYLATAAALGFALILGACGTTAATGAADSAGAKDANVAADGGSSPDSSSAKDSLYVDTLGGDSPQPDVVAVPVSIMGTWSSNFGGYEEISDKQWNDMVMAKLDGAARVAITQNPADEKYNPGKFNKIVFTAPKDGSFYYCYVDYGKATAALAEASTQTADASTPDKGGCGGFAWTRLTQAEPIAIAGTWKNNFGGTDTISSRKWNTAAISLFDNVKHWAITQNAADDKYYPSKFTKVVWTKSSGGSLSYCMVDFGLDSVALAQATTKIADDTAPDNGGCGGFSWTKLTP